MKRCVKTAALLVSALLTAVFLTAAASAVSAALNPTVTGDTVTVSVSCESAEPVTAIMIIPEYDGNVLTMNSGVWKVSGLLSDSWSEETGDAVIMFQDGKLLSGEIFTMTFTVRDTSAKQAKVGCGFIAVQDGPDDDIRTEIPVTEVTVTLGGNGSGASAEPPAQPQEPEASGDEGTTGEPAEPQKPSEPAKPTEPAKPRDPSRDEDPAQPSEPVTLIEPVPTIGTDSESGWKNPFRDVSSSDPYYDAIRFVYEKALFKGVSETEFAPATTMTRAMFVTVLGRLAGVDETAYMKTSFTDTDPVYGTWYIGYVEWASQNGIVKGYGDGKFGPNDMVTVEQAAVILARYAKYVGKYTDETADFGKYSDGAGVSDWAQADMAWALAKGIYRADNGALNPRAYAPRSLVATMLYHYVNLFGN